ncbi:two-component sensor histidine kinase [Bacillus luteolus]|uniref:histidine kinase n=1 Tax=Litchfieldia luteola TaxID=682179 RepID=A0ABR9QM15_9BACI|nr:ATP-binding protein [Cytobacillus luteolus]MBE4909529.1 two-component sensor histidine kinase [Cytobacillus luteolus]MBP1940930.1 two-component system, sporulation sensor kinase D [Cytobacillus luteolus]
MKLNTVIRNLLIYLAIVLLPTSITSYLLIQYKYDSLEKEFMEHTDWTLQFYKNHFDRFIGETIATTEALALVINPGQYEIAEIEDVLSKAHSQDSRYSGLYYVNEQGDILASSVNLQSPVNLADREYFQDVVRSKKTVISKAHTGRVSKRYIISIATPVTQEADYNGYLLLSIRLDYIENEMKVLTPNTFIRVTEMDGTEILSTASKFTESKGEAISTTLTHTPWTLEGKPNFTLFPKEELLNAAFSYIITTFIFTNILLILLKYVLLRRKTAFESAQNEAQKLELVGTLAASTAHEIRNPLTGIKGLIQLLSEKYTDTEDQFYFSVIDEEIKRINEIISEFLVLGKPTAEKTEDNDIRKIISELDPLILSEANLYNIKYRVINDGEHPLLVKCTKDHIKQVILNLTKNAFQAMPSNGTIVIQLQKSSSNCLITITDTGQGIPKEALSKIFEPFFTMKDTGTGLGLVVCRRIITLYGGTIEIESEVNVGTKVKIILPLSIKKTGYEA